MGGINPAGDEFSKDGQSGCLIIFCFFNTGYTGHDWVN
jgi:hypothetical protein